MPWSFLPLVEETVDRLLADQALPLRNDPTLARFIVCSRPVSRAWTTMGTRDGGYQFAPIPEQPLETQPQCADVAVWTVLRQLGQLTGDAKYRDAMDRMLRAFVQHAFDARSGLVYVGMMSQFNVVTCAPEGTYGSAPEFKPFDILPWDLLWEYGPPQMLRMCAATYYGLISRPETMDFNRFAPFGFDDSLKQPSLKFNPRHVGFVYSAAMLMYYWSMHFARSGDPEKLAWTRAMAEKWRKLQNPDTGLLPHFTGSVEADDPDMSPRPYANAQDDKTGVILLKVALELDGRPEGRELAELVRQMGMDQLRGIARYGYDPDDRRFITWIWLDSGKEYTDATFYMFRTQEDKDKAIKVDPQAEAVEVSSGATFWRGFLHDYRVGSERPSTLAAAARMTKDPYLVERAAYWARELMDETRPDVALNEAGQWVYPAYGNYARAMLDLYSVTGESRYLDHAKQLADEAVDGLAHPQPDDQPEWWRFPFRSEFLESLLTLEQALRTVRQHE